MHFFKISAVARSVQLRVMHFTYSNLSTIDFGAIILCVVFPGNNIYIDLDILCSTEMAERSSD